MVGQMPMDSSRSPGSHASTELHADAVRTVMAGLRQLPADDPRLDDYAMPE